MGGLDWIGLGIGGSGKEEGGYEQSVRGCVSIERVDTAERAALEGLGATQARRGL